ncbi:hypothetical protein [Massilia sp. YIM B04103]|uniref:hypothetical protein n=1 Tax=Massilia sp. YIM B04103 TaxID=2963106 RepID=UPI00210A5973|nr:hypothetical protein [Massilia sp. YIM B04103]
MNGPLPHTSVHAMTPLHTEFWEQNVARLEAQLLSQPLGRLFTGKLYLDKNAPFPGLDLSGVREPNLHLSPVEVGRLCMAPDESLIRIRRLREQHDGTPAGVHIISANKFLRQGEQIIVVAYKDGEGIAVRLNALHLARVMLDDYAPARLGTVAFGLMACTAYRFDFSKITLFAAGRGKRGHTVGADDKIGYQVWPKLGFDALLAPADLNAEPQLARCHSVQDVMQIDPLWWAAHGHGREMTFNLAPGSRSWDVLLHYISKVFAWEGC